MKYKKDVAQRAFAFVMTLLLTLNNLPVTSLAAALTDAGGQTDDAAATAVVDGRDQAATPDAPATATMDASAATAAEPAAEATAPAAKKDAKDAGAAAKKSSNAAGDAKKDAAPAADARDAETFDANNYVKRLTLSLRSGDVSKNYELGAGESVDTRPDFPDGLSRSAQYSASVVIDTHAMLQAQGKYPFVTGDKVTVRVPDIIRIGNATSGRLRDSTAEWDSANDGVGDYVVAQDAEGHNILTITYDDGYVAEKNGKILSSTVKLSGGFDTSTQTTEAFDTVLSFGSLTVTAKFSKLEVIRNLGIEKTGTVDDTGPYVSNSSPYYPRDKGATVDGQGYLTYTVTVKAGQDNTYKLTNVKVTDLFDDASKSKVDLKTVKLEKALVDGEDKTKSAQALQDADGNVNGWNIGDLPIGASATLTFKVKLDKDGITDAVDAAKAADPSTDAADARTLKNTATVTADHTDPVSDDYSTVVKNYVRVSKNSGSFDAATQRQHFSLKVSAPSDNRYTQHDVPIHDEISGGLAARYYKSSGVQSATVRHADGTTETVQIENYKQGPDSKSWYATIPELRPGDEVTIDSYLEVDESYWTNPAGAGRVGYGSSQANYAYVGNIGSEGYYSADLNRHYDYIYFTLAKNVLAKSNPSINGNGTVSWNVAGNELGKTKEPDDVGGLVLNDTLGPNQEFTDQTVTVYFYNESGLAGKDSFKIAAGSTSFSYTIPQEYGTCRYSFSYTSKITDWESYVGPAKSYTNTVNGVTGTTTKRARVAAMAKRFVRQADDWSQWTTSIYSELEAGDTYVDKSRSGTSHMYFTQSDLDAITMTIDGVDVDAGLYQVEPVQAGSSNQKYASYKVTFKGDVSVEKDGRVLKPSKDHPLVIGYKAHMVDPTSGLRNYYNDATLTAGNVSDSDYDHCRRENVTELRKEVTSSSGGYVTWLVKTNYGGYSGQPDGTCVVTDTLPRGLTYESIQKVQGPGEIDSVTPVVNADGTTTLTIKLSGLSHDEYCKGMTSDRNGSLAYELHFSLKTKITDPDFLYGADSKTFRFTNNVSLSDRYGHPKKASATASVEHVAMRKTMVYDDATAPYAEFSIEANKDKVDLNPNGDTVAIVDESSKSLAVDLKSISVVDARTGDPVRFTVDASKMADNQFTVRVPDNTYVKITYKAQVLGPVGSDVAVGNSAYHEGHKSTSSENTINKTVVVLNASGQAESEPMVWLSKKDESAKALADATFRLDEYDEASKTWKTLRPSIQSTGNDAVKGVKVESLELNKLYRFVETKAPSGYVLDATPHYFVLYKDAAPTVAYPDGVSADDVFQGPSGSLISVYDKPYTKVALQKMSDDGVQLAGAEFSVYAVAADGTVSATPATDEKGNEMTFVSSATELSEFYLAPGTYRLVETKVPAGYEKAADVTFAVVGDAARTVTVDGNKVADHLTVTDATAKVDLGVTKRWDDCSDFEGTRPGSATFALYADYSDGKGPVAVTGADGAAVTAEATAEGADGKPGTADDWAAIFSGLPAMRAGKAVSYTVREVDPATGKPVESGSELSDGYVSTVGATSGDLEHASDGYSVEVTNSRAPEPTSVSVSKAFDDAGDQDGRRPSSVRVQLLADGSAVGGRVATLDAGNGWAASFEGLPAANADGSAVVYTVAELDADGNACAFGDKMPDGYTPSLTAASFVGYPGAKNPTGDDAVAGGSGERSVSYEITDSYVPQKVDLGVTKRWDDNNNPSRPTSVTVDLLANGEKVDEAKIEAGDDNAWKHQFVGLDKYANGKEISYEVVESEVPKGYTSSVSGSVEEGFVVTNTKEPEVPAPSAPAKPTKPVKPVAGKLTPQTGDGMGSQVAQLLAMLGASAVCVAAAMGMRRKRSR